MKEDATLYPVKKMVCMARAHVVKKPPMGLKEGVEARVEVAEPSVRAS